jgi:hypothetical protein
MTAWHPGVLRANRCTADEVEGQIKGRGHRVLHRRVFIRRWTLARQACAEALEQAIFFDARKAGKCMNINNN